MMTTWGTTGSSIPSTVWTLSLANAFEKVQAGQVQPKPAGVGKVIYQVGNISFLIGDLSPTD
jgi:hypothetical protein